MEKPDDAGSVYARIAPVEDATPAKRHVWVRLLVVTVLLIVVSIILLKNLPRPEDTAIPTKDIVGIFSASTKYSEVYPWQSFDNTGFSGSTQDGEYPIIRVPLTQDTAVPLFQARAKAIDAELTCEDGLKYKEDTQFDFDLPVAQSCTLTYQDRPAGFAWVSYPNEEETIVIGQFPYHSAK